MPKPNLFWEARVKIHRLGRWVDGLDIDNSGHEFPIPFSAMTYSEQQLIVGVLKALCDELDDYRDFEGLRMSAAVVTRPSDDFDGPVTVMRGPKDREL
jgi:hypothetical protein